MVDFRLKVFVSAAHQLSFTKAAQELCVSQPAVSKHINELEREFGVSLFSRNGSRLTLTQAGQTLLRFAEAMMQNYNTLNYEMGLLTDKLRGELRVGASSTIAQYLLPPLLAKFFQHYPEVKFSLFSGNSTQIEEALFSHRIDVGLVETCNRRQGIHYENILKDELVLVADSRSNLATLDEVDMETLRSLPLVLRETGSGTLDVIESVLAQKGYKMDMLNVVMQLGSTEAIKLFIRNTDALAIMSIVAIRQELKNGTLKVIDIKGVEFVRQFTMVLLQGEQADLPDKFISFLKRHIHN